MKVDEEIYRNNLKNREFNKEAPHNFCLEQATIAKRQGASENKNYEVKPTPLKPDSSDCFGIIVEIERLGIYGEGVGRFEGLTLFVEGALPNERVRVCIYEVRKSFARARVIEWITRSPDRQKPICPLFGQCGGCQLMHLNYPQQLEAKRARVVDALKRIAKIDVEVLPCTPSPQELAYRNKIQLPVSSTHRLGLYARNSHTLIPIDECAIHCKAGEIAFSHLQQLLKKFKVQDLKHVLIKTAVNTTQVLVILITKTETPLTQLAQAIMESMPEIKGVVQNINPLDANVILGRKFFTLIGQGWIEESLCGLEFKVSPASFFQVNPHQAEALYQKVLQLACLTGKERVLDAYCGVGTLALICARAAKEVIGIESVPAAIVDAKENARRNGIENAQFLCGLAEKEIMKLGPIDVAIINPPRKGCDSLFLEALMKNKPKRILYVSCDPATLARDLHILTGAQSHYQVDVIQPFDMFPQTMHVECAVALSMRV